MDRRDDVPLLDRDCGLGPVLVIGLIGTVVATVWGVMAAEHSLLAAAALWAGLSVGLVLVIGIVRWASDRWRRMPPSSGYPGSIWYGPPKSEPPDPPPAPPLKRPPYPMHNYRPPTPRCAPFSDRESIDDHVKTVLRELRQLCRELNARVDELEGWTPSMEMRQKYVDQVCADAELLTTQDKGLCR